MPHASFLRNHGKTARSPRRPFEKERLDNEMKLNIAEAHRAGCGLSPSKTSAMSAMS